MIHRPFSFLLVASLLAYAVASFSGCGKPNSLSAIIVSPLTPVVAKGNTYQLLVTAIFSNRLAVPAWSQVTWTSANPLVATISSTGLVSGIVTGTAEITATDIFHPHITHTVTVYVTELDSITITPPSPSIPLASIPTATQQFMATGTYTASTPSSWSTSTTWPKVDITTSVLWTSSSTTVATIGNILGSQGLATAGSSTGTTTITATSQTGTLRTGTATLTVF
jgi:hypothetical protein